MHRRSRKIGKVAALAASEERRYGEQAGRSQRELNEQRNRLGELNAYRHNYARSGLGRDGVSAAHWQDYQNFLSRLDKAIKAQQQIVQDCEQTLASHRQRWLAKRRKVESLERVLDKYKARETAYAEKLEQKLLDDMPGSQAGGFDPDNG